MVRAAYGAERSSRHGAASVNAAARIARDERYSLAGPSLITDTQQTYSPLGKATYPPPLLAIR
jgi:hypothetical protein